MIWQEKIEKTLSFGFLPQLMDDLRSLPAIAFQLLLVNALRGNALILNPIVNLLDLLNGNWSELCFHPWRDASESWVAIHLDVGCHCKGMVELRQRQVYGGKLCKSTAVGQNIEQLDAAMVGYA